MVPQSRIVGCQKMYKISNKVIKFISEANEKLASGINSRRKNVSRGENPERHHPVRGAVALTIFNSDGATQLYPYKGYKCTKSQEKINHLMYIDDIQLFAKKGK